MTISSFFLHFFLFPYFLKSYSCILESEDDAFITQMVIWKKKSTSSPSKEHKKLPEKRSSETPSAAQPYRKEKIIGPGQALVADEAVTPDPKVSTAALSTSMASSGTLELSRKVQA